MITFDGFYALRRSYRIILSVFVALGAFLCAEKYAGLLQACITAPIELWAVSIYEPLKIQVAIGTLTALILFLVCQILTLHSVGVRQRLAASATMVVTLIVGTFASRMIFQTVAGGAISATRKLGGRAMIPFSETTPYVVVPLALSLIVGLVAIWVITEKLKTSAADS